MPHPPAFQDIAENLSFLDDWEDRYRYLIELGQALPPLAEGEKTAATKVSGCAVAGVVGQRARRATICVIAASPMHTSSGGWSPSWLPYIPAAAPEEIADTDAMAVFDELGLREHLSYPARQWSSAMVAASDLKRRPSRPSPALQAPERPRPDPASAALNHWLVLSRWDSGQNALPIARALSSARVSRFSAATVVRARPPAAL